MTTPRLLLLGAACLPALASESVRDDDASSALLTFVNTVSYEITQRITATNGDVAALGLLELNLPIPLDWPEQGIGNLEVKGDRTNRLRDVDALGMIVRSLYRTRRELPGPGASKSLSASYRLTRKEIRADTEALAARSYAPYDQRSPEFRLNTRNEKSIEVDAVEITRLAADLKARTNGPYHFAKGAYDYVLDHTAYVSPSPSHGARECLLKGQADCGSYALLFVAICRAGGVPARPVAGCWALGVNQWHCWAEFLLPGVGWIPVDPTVGDRGPEERKSAFGNLDNNRVALAKTFNLSVRTTNGSRDLGFVQVGTWWWYPAPGSKGSEMAVEHYFMGKKIAN